MTRATVTGWGKCVPPAVLSNHDLEQVMDTSLGSVLWLVAGFLMVASVLGIVLALALGKVSPSSATAREAEAVAAEPVDQETLVGRKAAYRQGLIVLIGLALLTLVEYVLAVALNGSVGFLFVIALIKAGIIIQYYMHLNRVWDEEAHS